MSEPRPTESTPQESPFAPLAFPTMLCLTLGLAPFFPEPHILGKIRWVQGGAVGMGAIDWFDLVLHGFPWVYWLFVAGKVAVGLAQKARA